MASKGISKILISRKFKKLSVENLYVFAKGTRFTGDLDCINPYHDDIFIYGLADGMMKLQTKRQIKPSKSATIKVRIVKRNLNDALDDNAGYLDMIANRVACKNGDLNSGLNVVLRIGFKFNGKGDTSHIFGIVNWGEGWIFVREEKAQKGKEGHVWKGGFTIEKGIPPINTKQRFTLEAECFFSNLTSSTVFAYRHASILPVAGKANNSTSSTINSIASGKASLTPMSSSKHPIIDFNDDEPYNFGEWHYIVIR